MSSRREFEIAFVGLKAGIHEFSYRITDRFFEAYQQQGKDAGDNVDAAVFSE